ncbi:MAG: OmpA family protein [Fibromonadaceae bacterium]|nr:OmpA family protein [Fibromonadaceae bacterium]
MKLLRILPIFLIMVLATAAFALPVGDPRTPDDEELSKIDVPIEQGVHELSVHAYMGASKIDYPDVGGTKFSPGFGAAITYNFFFFPQWSILVGGGIHLFNNRVPVKEPDFSSDKYGPVENVRDDDDKGLDGEGFDDREYSTYSIFYRFGSYTETQWSLMFMVPIMLQYQSNETRNKAFYYGLGVKLGFPFAGSYEGKVGSAELCGWPTFFGDAPATYDKCIAEGGLADNENPMQSGANTGFGDFGRITSNSRLKLGTAFFAAMEAGVKWRIYNKLAVYTGFWMDWALNDVALSTVSARRNSHTNLDPKGNPDPFSWTGVAGNAADPHTPKAGVEFKSRSNGKAIPVSMGFTFRVSLGAGTHNAVADSIRWIREIAYRDSLLNVCYDENDRLLADSVAAADSIAYLNAQNEALLDSLLKCRGECMAEAMSREALQRQMDSLAREAELRRLADLERARLAALEKARLDSIENAKLLEAQKAARLADFRKKLASISNGLDDYKVTQTIPSNAAREKLDIAADLMKDYPDLKIRLSGHTCDRGTHEANVRFGMQRAESGKNYLVKAKGIDASRIETASKAEVEPVVPNTSEDNRRKNRRIQIEILEGGLKEEGR